MPLKKGSSQKTISKNIAYEMKKHPSMSQKQAQAAKEKEAEKKVDRKVASLTVEKMGAATKADKVTLIKAQIALDPELQDLEDAYHQCYVNRKAWEVMLSNQERDITLVSREISRRDSEMKRRSI